VIDFPFPTFKALARKVYESAYAELSREVYYQVANEKVSGRRVMLRMKKKQEELRSLFVVVISGEELIKFRYTVPSKEFKEREFDDFVRAWLSIASNRQISSSALANQPHTVQEKEPSLDKESEIKRQKILREVEARWKEQVLGKFSTETKTITLDHELLEDPDLSLAILSHELVHAAYPHEEELDREIDRITSMYGIVLKNEDYRVWGICANFRGYTAHNPALRHTSINRFTPSGKACSWRRRGRSCSTSKQACQFSACQ
jgi:hypothetical protein